MQQRRNSVASIIVLYHTQEAISVHLSDFFQTRLKMNFPPRHSCVSPPRTPAQSPAPMHMMTDILVNVTQIGHSPPSAHFKSEAQLISDTREKQHCKRLAHPNSATLRGSHVSTFSPLQRFENWCDLQRTIESSGSTPPAHRSSCSPRTHR